MGTSKYSTANELSTDLGWLRWLLSGLTVESPVTILEQENPLDVGLGFF
jgi:hypothetical protein